MLRYRSNQAARVMAKIVSERSFIKQILNGARADLKANIKDRFTFDPGQVLFDGENLDLPSGKPTTMLKRLVESFGRVVPYTEFDEYYTSATPGIVHKSKREICKSFERHKVPCEVIPKTGEGYVITERRPMTKRKKRVRKK